MIDAFNLGATLYIPAIRDNLSAIANGEKYPHLRSMVFCTEDAIHEHELDLAIANLTDLLAQMQPRSTLRFIRARNPAVLERLLGLPQIEKIDGFVFPKVDLHNYNDYFSLVTHAPFKNMLTLESKETFEQDKMCQLRDKLLMANYQQHLLALRIGGNDLLHHLGLRRPVGKTLYETPLGLVINQLITVFKPYGFELTAPVFEHLNTPAILQHETQHDIQWGLVGKTAIHPTQVAVIESCFKVHASDVAMAHAILAHEATAVFKMHDSMCEIATHHLWASCILKRYEIYGVTDSSSAISAADNANKA
jgi:citrate lyase beta subunit